MRQWLGGRLSAAAEADGESEVPVSESVEDDSPSDELTEQV